MPKKKKTTAKKPATKKPAAKKAKKTKRKPATTKRSSSTEERLAKDVLQLVDQAANLLRSGIRSTAATSAKARKQTKKQAHALLSRAGKQLESALNSGTSLLSKAISKL
jgi:ElaB/YqjD/DUF883 family membrane-anchored ribosome-binding protein